jgi:hypothetical protein
MDVFALLAFVEVKRWRMVYMHPVYCFHDLTVEQFLSEVKPARGSEVLSLQPISKNGV